jgi:hypothetical protein
MAKKERRRVNMRLPEDVVVWAHRTAKLREKSFTWVVERAMREAMEGDQYREAVARRILRGRRLNAADV